MDENTSLINIGELSRPATVLIEKMSVGRAQLTRVGEELAPICGATAVDGFFELMVEYWKGQDWIKVSEFS